MARDPYIRRAAEIFWQRVGYAEPFPRQLEDALLLAFPVSIIKLSGLQISTIEGWFQHRAVSYQFPCTNRQLRGCLVAHRGHGLIFLDPADPPDEGRLTLAHEVAHFLEDYLRPRETAMARLGPAIRAVLDGERPPTIEERVHAVLAGVSLAVYHNYMERDPHGLPTLSAVWNAEDRADQLALELIAPADAVWEQAAIDQPQYQQRLAALTHSLTSRFGLPPDMADLYGQALLQSIDQGPSFLERLGLPTP